MADTSELLAIMDRAMERVKRNFSDGDTETLGTDLLIVSELAGVLFRQVTGSSVLRQVTGSTVPA